MATTPFGSKGVVHPSSNGTRFFVPRATTPNSLPDYDSTYQMEVKLLIGIGRASTF
jgi:hypothetical protein